ncbi:MAG: YbaN family protein [Devosia sp.]
MRRSLWLFLGMVSLALGGIGVFLPLLPTTPFVLVAVFAFTKSAPSWAARLETSKMFGPTLAAWRTNGSISPPVKALAISMMALVLLLSLAFAVPVAVIAVQAVCMAGASAFILTRPNGPR